MSVSTVPLNSCPDQNLSNSLKNSTKSIYHHSRSLVYFPKKRTKRFIISDIRPLNISNINVPLPLQIPNTNELISKQNVKDELTYEKVKAAIYDSRPFNKTKRRKEHLVTKNRWLSYKLPKISH